VRESLATLHISNNIEIVSMADVSAGTGMGSSGSYLVALLLALHALKRDHLPRWALAEEACEIEIHLAAHPVGKQDQYVAAWGGLNSYTVACDGQVTVEPVRIPTYAQEDLTRCLLLFNTGQTRQSERILTQQKADTESGDTNVIESLHRTKELGYQIKDSLEAGDLARFGDLTDRHWQNKRKRSNQISNARIDRIYAIARENGALGGKLMGAGGGGFLILLAPHEAVRRVREAVSNEGLRHVPFSFEMDGAKVLLDV
jgi:D-glycero-alpha-D-manno-heptose-7-phosphate kinase